MAMHTEYWLVLVIALVVSAIYSDGERFTVLGVPVGQHGYAVASSLWKSAMVLAMIPVVILCMIGLFVGISARALVRLVRPVRHTTQWDDPR